MDFASHSTRNAHTAHFDFVSISCLSAKRWSGPYAADSSPE